nr:hypothetical protein CFP56_11800 [Quercus suber]
MHGVGIEQPAVDTEWHVGLRRLTLDQAIRGIRCPRSRVADRSARSSKHSEISGQSRPTGNPSQAPQASGQHVETESGSKHCPKMTPPWCLVAAWIRNNSRRNIDARIDISGLRVDSKSTSSNPTTIARQQPWQNLPMTQATRSFDIEFGCLDPENTPQASALTSASLCLNHYASSQCILNGDTYNAGCMSSNYRLTITTLFLLPLAIDYLWPF